MKLKFATREKPEKPQGIEEGRKTPADIWLPKIGWGVALIMVGFTVFVAIKKVPGIVLAEAPVPTPTPIAPIPQGSGGAPHMPDIVSTSLISVSRAADGHTSKPSRPLDKVQHYIVEKGDSVFSISKQYDLKPESILWANFDTLQDDPQMLSVGIDLNIPPTDGVYYKVTKYDTLEKIASKFHVHVEDIVMWPSNKLDFVNPKIEVGQYLMIPGGVGEVRQWIVPDIAKGKSGTLANSKIIGPGACETGEGGAVGTGSFIWPTNNVHKISGNDYWSGHLGIDIAALTGDYIKASDSGVVVYAGPIGGGYGNFVMIDHGNGYRTAYGHNSAVLVRCGQSVTQGQTIALAGSTGNSTGPHLHFEIRYYGGFINPWALLN
ncbi:peptidoglycan DD-metalloendopeptidase family protein [Leptolinea tardivitalis]|uniref:peptidoglycan DD-metalloendopeptidase family protein n=1 Tax=Leptolinea tardivitalis TaxID=229920 RepID=UPI0007821147|nr:M23 family metallopeptidase [Leptolinea tardivitalis]GAP22275.1 membrane protein related to metalloendopeptidases [Leptolinea tardivitalis]